MATRHTRPAYLGRRDALRLLAASAGTGITAGCSPVAEPEPQVVSTQAGALTGTALAFPDGGHGQPQEPARVQAAPVVNVLQLCFGVFCDLEHTRRAYQLVRSDPRICITRTAGVAYVSLLRAGGSKPPRSG